MNDEPSLAGFTLRLLAPLALVMLIWVWLGTSLLTAFDLLIVTFIVSFLLTLAWSSMCAWWFTLSRKAPANVPLVLSAVLGLSTLLALKLFAGGWASLGLNSAVAVILKSTLQIITIGTSFVFILALLLSDVGIDAEEE